MDNEECVICMGAVVEPVELPCGQAYCRACLQGLREKGVDQACPLCRAELLPGSPTRSPALSPMDGGEDEREGGGGNEGERANRRKQRDRGIAWLREHLSEKLPDGRSVGAHLLEAACSELAQCGDPGKLPAAAAYVARFDDCPKRAVRLDKTPEYLFHSRTATRVACASPRARA